MVGLLGVSAVVGLPPFTATTLLAGTTRMRLSLFVTAGLLGRFVRYSALAAIPALLTTLTW
jgi:membrane protein YqaA with SNARE-associated domain